MLKVEGVSKSFGPVRALRNATIAIGAHEVVGLIGENGAGKSTLMRILSGGMRPDAGTIAVDGSAVALRDAAQANRYGIAMVFQEQSLLLNMSVADNLHLANERPFTRFGVISRRRMIEAARDRLARVGLDIDPTLKAGELGFAARQMVELAKALSLEERTNAPLTILLDEPTSVLESQGHRNPFRADKELEIASELRFRLAPARRSPGDQRPHLCDEGRRDRRREALQAQPALPCFTR